jgi:3-hydroxyacyl-[acyl-carrier-protein] dehydratase
MAEGDDRGPQDRGVEIDYAEVMRRLPHRYPFLLIDRAESFVANTSIVGVKNVSHNEPFFQGHFPIDPVMPGVLIVEAMAQTGALLMSKTLDVAVEGKVIMFMSIDGVRFRKPARPGDQLRMHVVVTRARGDAFKFRGETYIDGKLAAEAEFMAMVVTVAEPVA